MENESPFLAMQRAETFLKGLLRTMDTDLLSVEEKRLLASLRRLARETRLDIRDYELSETRDEQLKKAATSKQGLDKLKATVLSGSYLFSAADVAQLDANLEHIKGRVL